MFLSLQWSISKQTFSSFPPKIRHSDTKFSSVRVPLDRNFKWVNGANVPKSALNSGYASNYVLLVRDLWELRCRTVAMTLAFLVDRPWCRFGIPTPIRPNSCNFWPMCEKSWQDRGSWVVWLPLISHCWHLIVWRNIARHIWRCGTSIRRTNVFFQFRMRFSIAASFHLHSI